MLTSEIKFTYKGQKYNFKGYLSDLTHGGLLRLVAQDGLSAQMLMQGQSEVLGRTYRTATMSRASFTVERLIKPKTLFGEDGTDLSVAKSFQKHPSFALFAYIYAVYSYAKSLKNEMRGSKGFLALSLKELENIEDRVEFEVPFGKGVIERKYGLVKSLRFATQTESDNISLEFGFVEDSSFEFLPNQERVSMLGSDVIRMDSVGTAYKTEISNNLRRQLLGLPKIEVVTDLKGLSGSVNPFYTTMAEVIEVENMKAKVEQRTPRNFEWVRERVQSGKYRVVKPHEVEETFKQLEKDYKKTKLTAFDTETTGLDFTFRGFYGKGSIMVGAVLSAKPGTSYYFPLAHKKFPNVCGGDIELFVEKYLQPYLGNKRVVAHNNIFDWKVGYRHGLVYDCWLDTLVAMRKTYSARDNEEYGLKAVTDKFLHREAVELDDLTKCGSYKKCGATFDELEEELVAFYACPDADNTLCIALYFLENDILGKSGFDMMQAVLHDSRFTCVAAYSEFYGMHLNLDSVPQLRLHYGRQLVSEYRDLLEFLAIHVPQHAEGGKFAIQTKANSMVLGLDAELPKDSKVLQYHFEDYPDVYIAAQGGYSVNSPMNKTVAYDYLGYPEQISKKSGNSTLDKNALKFLNKGTKPDKEPFRLSFDDFSSRCIQLLSTWLGHPQSKEKLESIIKDNSQKKLVRGLARFIYLVERRETSSFTDLDYETLRIVTKYIYGETLGYKTVIEVEEGKGFLVKPEEGAPIHPFTVILESPRNTARLFTNFLDKVEDNFIEGFCFPELDMFKVTGRLSTKKPNIQGFDDTIKKEMTARNGYYMVDTDYASKENRVIAIMSKEQSLIEMFKDWRNDYHRFQSARLNGLLQEQVTDKLRKMSKGLVFGINFGMSDMSLGEVLFGSRSKENARKAAQKREEFFSFQRSVEGWFENNVKTALSKGYSTTIFGSKRFYNKDRVSKSQIRRYALNHPIQGSAADIYKKGMVDLFSDIKEQGYLGKILLTGFIHDEATIEVHNTIHPHVVLGLIRKNLMVEIEGGCPLDLGFGVGHSWYTAKKTEWQVGLQELMEWNLDAYDWDGNIDKFMEWAENRIHEFNAEDVENKLRSTAFTEDTIEQDRVFQVNYALELNKYLLGELTKTEHSWEQAKGILDFPEDFEELSGGERKEFIYLHLPDLHIHKRLQLFWNMRNSFDVSIIAEYRDLSDLENVKNSVAKSEVSEDEEQKKQRERNIQLLKDHLMDFGSKLSSDGSVLYLQYAEGLYSELGSMVVSTDTNVPTVKIIMYIPKEDKFTQIPNVGVPQALLSDVVKLARSYVI